MAEQGIRSEPAVSNDEEQPQEQSVNDESRADQPELRVWISPDRVKVLLDCPDPHAALDSVVERVETELCDLDLPAYPQNSELEQLIKESCVPGEHCCEVPLVRGTPPVAPVDGRVEWQDDFFATGFETDEDTGAVDYWNKIDKRGVHAGQLLVQVFPEIPGEPGEDVFGKTIKVTKPEKVRIKAGGGIEQRTDEDGAINYEAAVDGRLRYVDNILAVDDVYVVKGNADLETGNIRHAGALVIEGDVLVGATIEADGDIDVKGMCEPSDIRAGGDLVVAGGIIGNDAHRVDVGGRLQAKYLLDVRATVENDVEIAGEITHSFVKTRGRILVPRGRIAGGEAVALGGIRVDQAGADGAAETILKTAIDFREEEEIPELIDQVSQFRRARITIGKAMASAAKHQRSLTEQQKQTVALFEERGRRLRKIIECQQAKLESLTRDSGRCRRPLMVITSESHPGTTFFIGNESFRLNKSIFKPRLVVLKGRRVRIVPLGEDNMPDDL